MVMVMWHIVYCICPEIFPERLKLETSNFVYLLARWSISFVMLDYPPNGYSQGNLTHFYVFGPGRTFEADEARRFKYGLHIKRKEC